jgi:hypothetical protein
MGTRTNSRWNERVTSAVLHQPSSLASRFTKTLTVNPEIELNSPTNQSYPIRLSVVQFKARMEINYRYPDSCRTWLETNGEALTQADRLISDSARLRCPIPWILIRKPASE